MSDSIPPKAAVYVPACYIMIRSGYEVAESVIPCPSYPQQLTPVSPHSAPYPCSPSKDENPEERLLINTSSDNPAVDDTATPECKSVVETNFQKLQETLSELSSQLTSLAASQSRSESHILQIEKLCQQNAAQITLLTENQTNIQRQQAETQRGAMQSLKEAQAASTKLLASDTAAVNDLSSNFDKGGLCRVRKLGKGGCRHNVHPPPRKIDRPVVGYDYGMGDGDGWRVDRAPGLLRC